MGPESSARRCAELLRSQGIVAGAITNPAYMPLILIACTAVLMGTRCEYKHWMNSTKQEDANSADHEIGSKFVLMYGRVISVVLRESQDRA